MDLNLGKIGNTSADETEWMGQYVWKNPREAATSEPASTQGQIKGVWKAGSEILPMKQMLLAPVRLGTIHILAIVNR